jgi:hypothetical protein
MHSLVRVFICPCKLDSWAFVLYQACHGNLLKPNAWCLMQGQLLSRGQFLIPLETQNLTVSLYSELPLLCHACLSPYIYIYIFGPWELGLTFSHALLKDGFRKTGKTLFVRLFWIVSRLLNIWLRNFLWPWHYKCFLIWSKQYNRKEWEASP